MTYHLVLELKPRDFMPIDINILAGTRTCYNTLESIDSFTKRYSKSELFEMIKENNIVPEKYLNGTIKIINDKKYRYPVLSKENVFTFDKYFIMNINNKTEMNKFINIFNKYCDDTKILKDLIKRQDIRGIIKLVISLPYENTRKIYFYLEKQQTS